MDKLHGQSMDLENKNIEELKKLFPNAVIEGKIDFEKLKLMLGEEIDDSIEKYHFTWNGKSKAIKLAQMPSTATLRPSKEDSVDWDTTENLYIEGDNLEVLKQLQKTYFGKIKMIYIDPPYNTGNDFIYKNDFKDLKETFLQLTKQNKSSNTETSGRYHTNWLNMMYPRLLLAKNLLTETGIICVTIDDYEVSRLLVIMDELFGESNHLGTIPIRNNPAGRSTTNGVSITHEYAIFYGKSSLSQVGRLPRNEKQINRYNNEDEKGKFEWVNFRKPGSKKSESPKMYYPILIENNNIMLPEMVWNENSSEWIIKQDLNEEVLVVYPIDDKGKKRRWRWSKERFLNEIDDLEARSVNGKMHIYMKGRINESGILPMTWWGNKKYSSTAYGANLLKDMFDALQIFSYPKSIYAVMDALRVLSNDNSGIVLDFFSGSATTAHAVMKLNAEDEGTRKFIMVQLPELTKKDSEPFRLGYKNICEIGKERIRRAGQQLKQELIDKKNRAGMLDENIVDPESLDIGFKVFKLDETNIKAWDSSAEVTKESLLDQVEVIKENRLKEDVLYEILLKYGVFNHTVKEITINDKAMYDIADGYMIVNLNDKIEDTDVKEITKRSPHVVIFLESGFVNDNDKINAEATLKHNGVEDVKCI